MPDTRARYPTRVFKPSALRLGRPRINKAFVKRRNVANRIDNEPGNLPQEPQQSIYDWLCKAHPPEKLQTEAGPSTHADAQAPKEPKHPIEDVMSLAFSRPGRACSVRCVGLKCAHLASRGWLPRLLRMWTG